MAVFVMVLDTKLARLHHIQVEYDEAAIKFTRNMDALLRGATVLITLIYWF